MVIQPPITYPLRQLPVEAPWRTRQQPSPVPSLFQHSTRSRASIPPYT